MTIYDGPGILSPVILNEPNATRVKLSSYQGYVTYNQWAILTEYSDANNHSHINAQIFRWFSRIMVRCQDFRGNNAVLWSTNQCFWGNRIATIRQMLFTGYNMLSHSDNNIMYSGCQYGGFFQVNMNTKRDYFKICSNVTKESSVPDMYTLGTTYIFITFQGYSSGFIEFVFSEDICRVINIAISRGPSCNNVQSTVWRVLFSNKLVNCSGCVVTE